MEETGVNRRNGGQEKKRESIEEMGVRGRNGGQMTKRGSMEEMEVKGRNGGRQEHGRSRFRRGIHEAWFESGRCDLRIVSGCWRYSDCR